MSVKPRTAAACIVQRGDGEQILMARRSPKLRFMAGHHVFPGGQYLPEDQADYVQNAADDQHARSIAAAVREVFEETGLLCVRGALPDPGVTRSARIKLLAEDLDFAGFLQSKSLKIDATDFQAAGQWVTPPFSPIRFQTEYYHYQVSDDQQAELIEGEMVGLDWFTPTEARERWHQGEIRISTPVAYTLRQLAAVGLPAALPLLQRGTERVPGEHNWFEIRRGITLIPLITATIPPATHTNCVVVGEDPMYVIDPGADDVEEREHLHRQVEHMIEIGGRVDAVLLTHSHVDHVAGATAFRAKFDVPIMAHPATAQQLGFPVDRLLDDGEILTCGEDCQWRLKCVHTPGHDPGHLCFYEESTRTLIAGDMVANPGTIFVSHAFGGDMQEFMQSLQRLSEIPAKIIVPAHGQPASRPAEFVRGHLKHRLWREQKIQSIWEGGVTDFDDLLNQAYDDAAPEAMPLARHSLEAHLKKLGIDLPATS